MLQQVELASTFFNKFFQLATSKFCCVTMFEVGGNIYGEQRLRCKLQQFVARISSPLMLRPILVAGLNPCAN